MKKTIVTIIIAMSMLALTACKNEKQDSKNTAIEETGQEAVSAEAEPDKAQKKGSTKVDFKHPSDFLVCEGDDMYFTPVTEDYVISIETRDYTDTGTELTCFDERGNSVSTVYRRTFQDEKTAKESIESFGLPVASSKDEFDQNKNIIAWVGNAIYQRLEINEQEGASLSNIKKMLYFYKAADKEKQSEIWFSLPELSEQQLSIQNYCDTSDFEGSSHFEPASEDYYLESNDFQDHKQIDLISFNKAGDCIQIDTYYVFQDKEKANRFVKEQGQSYDGKITNYGDGTILMSSGKDSVIDDYYNKENKFFSFQPFDTMEQWKNGQSTGNYAMKYFSVPSIAEDQCPEYLKLVKSISQ